MKFKWGHNIDCFAKLLLRKRLIIESGDKHGFSVNLLRCLRLMSVPTKVKLWNALFNIQYSHLRCRQLTRTLEPQFASHIEAPSAQALAKCGLMNWEWGVPLTLCTHPPTAWLCSVPIAALTASIYITLVPSPHPRVHRLCASIHSIRPLVLHAFVSRVDVQKYIQVDVHMYIHTCTCTWLAKRHTWTDYSRRNIDLPRFERNWRRARRFPSIRPSHAKRKAIRQTRRRRKLFSTKSHFRILANVTSVFFVELFAP